MDSEEEFEDAEPVLNLSQLKLAGSAAHAAYSPVRERFANEKAYRRKEIARVMRKQKSEQKRGQRRRSSSAASLPSPPHRTPTWPPPLPPL